MLKELLTELRDVFIHLERAGYFRVAPGGVTPERARTSDAPLVAVGIKQPRRPIEQKPREKGLKLTRADALDIYNEDRLSQAELAKIYSVSMSTIAQIKQGFTWWRVTGATPHPRRSSVTQKKSRS